MIIKRDEEISTLKSSLDAANLIVASTTSPTIVKVASEPIIKTVVRTVYTPAICSTTQAVTPPPPVQVKENPVVIVTSPDYTKYTSITLHDYAVNPAKYSNQKIEITNAYVADFIPFGMTGENYGYVRITNGSDVVIIKINDVNAYSQISEGLSIKDPVVVYGIGAASKLFQNIATTGVTYNSYFALIDLDRISKWCDGVTCKNNKGEYYIYAK